MRFGELGSRNGAGIRYDETQFFTPRHLLLRHNDGSHIKRENGKGLGTTQDHFQ